MARWQNQEIVVPESVSAIHQGSAGNLVAPEVLVLSAGILLALCFVAHLFVAHLGAPELNDKRCSCATLIFRRHRLHLAKRRLQYMGSIDEIEQELEFLSERIQQLRSLQESQRHLAFVTIHLQEHIDQLQTRIRELKRHRVA
jgi:hypothetical protein